MRWTTAVSSRRRRRRRLLSAPSSGEKLMPPFCACAGSLWYRQGLAPSYPQGSSWELISNNAAKVSVGPLDQVKAGPPPSSGSGRGGVGRWDGAGNDPLAVRRCGS